MIDALSCSNREGTVVRCLTEEATRSLGEDLATVVAAGDRIGLCGPLGAGKTAFVRGLAQGLGIPAQKVRSPTFTLVNEYSGGRLRLYHVDFYRIEATPLDRLSLREVMYGDGVTVAEWWDRIEGETCHLRIDIRIVGVEERVLELVAFDQRYAEWARKLKGHGLQWH